MSGVLVTLLNVKILSPRMWYVPHPLLGFILEGCELNICCQSLFDAERYQLLILFLFGVIKFYVQTKVGGMRCALCLASLQLCPICTHIY